MPTRTASAAMANELAASRAPGTTAASVLLHLEGVVMVAIMCLVVYTEIDWKAYMQEVSGFLDGELDYERLRGDTGPLVYPGGFVWLFSGLYYITCLGQDIALAQVIYYLLYMSVFSMALRLYTGAHIGWRGFIALFISKRIRSIFVLRLFNDCWAMFFLFIAVTLFVRQAQQQRPGWKLGCLMFSMAVSIKMNVLLFAPGLLYVLLRAISPQQVVVCLSICALWQLVVAAPFLLHHPISYLRKSFELGRVFDHQWSVNYQWLPEEVFVRPELGAGLLVATLLCWVIAWRLRWSKRNFTVADARRTQNSLTLAAGTIINEKAEREVFVSIVLTLFESNLIGVALSRSLHYQFYSWFFHSVPLLLHFTKLPRIARLLLFGLIRQGFESYPPSVFSSAFVLLALLVSVVALLFFGDDDPDSTMPATSAAAQKQLEPADADAATSANVREKKNQ